MSTVSQGKHFIFYPFFNGKEGRQRAGQNKTPEEKAYMQQSSYRENTEEDTTPK